MNLSKAMIIIGFSLVAASCATTAAEDGIASGHITGYIDGNAITDIPYDEAVASGFEYGDIITLSAGELSIAMPVCHSGEDVDSGMDYQKWQDKLVPYLMPQVQNLYTNNKFISRDPGNYRPLGIFACPGQTKISTTPGDVNRRHYGINYYMNNKPIMRVKRPSERMIVCDLGEAESENPTIWHHAELLPCRHGQSTRVNLLMGDGSVKGMRFDAIPDPDLGASNALCNAFWGPWTTD